MKESLLDVILMRDARKTRKIIKLINDRSYQAVLDAAKETPNFTIVHEDNLKKIRERLELEVINYPDLVGKMYGSDFPDKEYYFDFLLSMNKEAAFKVVMGYGALSSDIVTRRRLMTKCVEAGINPMETSNAEYFIDSCDSDLINLLLDKGIGIPNEILMHNTYRRIYSDPKLVNRLIRENNFNLTREIVMHNELYKRLDQYDGIETIIDLGSLDPSSSVFHNNTYAIRKALKANPEIIEKIRPQDTKLLLPFLKEGVKVGVLPKRYLEFSKGLDHTDYFVFTDESALRSLIQFNPRYCIYNRLTNREPLYEYALSQGYEPTIEDYRMPESAFGFSKAIMSKLLKTHPELLEFCDEKIIEDVAPIAIEAGFVPTIKMVERNYAFLRNFDILSALIKSDPSAIKIVPRGENAEKLLELAISLGYNGDLFPTNDSMPNILSTESGIIYELKRTGKLSEEVLRNIKDTGCGPRLYNEMIKYGINPIDYIDLFKYNFDVMKSLIEIDPSLISKIPGDLPFSRDQVDLLCLRAVELGYDPKVTDLVFGRGYESAKLMLRKDPNFIKSVRLLDPKGLLNAEPCKYYDEFMNIAMDSGFKPTIDDLEQEPNKSAGYRYYHSFVYSDRVMMELISITPSLIEKAEYRDAASWDKMCSYALSLGYEPDLEGNSFSSSRFETERKLLKSPTMARHIIEKNPDHIRRISIDDPDQCIELFRLAQEKGFDFDNLSDNYYPRLFSTLTPDQRKEFLNEEQVKVMETYDEQREKNDEVSETLNPSFADEYYKRLFSKEQYEMLSNYSMIQYSFTALPKESFIESFMLSIADRYSNDLSWVEIFRTALERYSKDDDIKALFASFDPDELTDDDKKNLEDILINGNKYNITSFEELRRIDEIKEEYYEKLSIDSSISCQKTLYFEKMYGIDLGAATSLLQEFGASLEGIEFDKLSEQEKEIFSIIQDIKRIIDLEDIEEIKKVTETIPKSYKVDPTKMLTLKGDMKNVFLHKINDTLYHPGDTPVETVDNIPVYLAAGEDGSKEFRMMMTSLGAYTHMKAPDNFEESFNMSKTLTHHCCCSYIGNQSIGTATIKYACLGFSDYADGMLHLSSPTDLVSSSERNSATVTSVVDPTYLLPEDILNSTRHTHNESTFERRDLGKGEHFKKQPSYVVYHCDNLSDRETIPNYMKTWEYAVKCSRDFEKRLGHPLPIVVVEREKIAQKEVERINAQMSSFKETFDPSLIEKIITRYESNYAGNREYHQNICDKYFPRAEELGSSVPGKIEKVIRKLSKTNPEKAIELFNELKKAVLLEKKRYSAVKYQGIVDKASFNIDGMLASIENNIQLAERRMKGEVIEEVVEEKIENTESFLEKLSMIPSTSKDFEEFYSLLGENYDCASINSLLQSKYADLVTYIDTYIDDKKLNISDKAHSPRHIKDVALFSLLIGKDLSKDKLELLIQSAMYHDSGRTNDGSSKHSEASAIKAGNDLIQYKDKGLGLIQTIIDFHEVSRSYPKVEQDRIFMEMYNKYTSEADRNLYSVEEIRQLAEMLKDADALDRTRFYRRGAMLNPELLVYPESKKLMKFACSIQEKYALDDLRKYLDEERIAKYSNYESPKRIIKVIRNYENQGYTREQIVDYLDKMITNYETLHSVEETTSRSR